MKKYHKFKKKKTINLYILFFVAIVGISTMAVGYAISTESLTIKGTANARYEKYGIVYELFGGTNPENAIKEFTIADEITPLPIPTKEGYAFKGWYNNSDFIGAPIQTTEGFSKSITLYAKWRQVVYSDVVFDYPGSYYFDGTNYINTNIYLYSEENVNRNFMMSFNIESIGENNQNHSALANSMDESGKPWPGHVVKITANNTVLFESNSNTSGEGNIPISSSVKNVRIFRLNNYMYVSFDGDYLIRVNDYNGFTDTFDIPVMFGASLDGNKNPFRFFNGTLSDMHVEFLSDEAEVEDFNPQKEELKVAYQHDGPYTFDGESDYIDTGLTLFSADKANKDFEISFNIDSIADGYVNQATIVNAKNERITSYPGFVYRLYIKDKTVKLEAKAGTGSGATNKQSDVQSVKISRIDSIIYISINGGTYKQAYDFTGFTNFFDVPLTIGASLDKNGNPFRFFKGTLSDIIVKIEQ